MYARKYNSGFLSVTIQFFKVYFQLRVSIQEGQTITFKNNSCPKLKKSLGLWDLILEVV